MSKSVVVFVALTAFFSVLFIVVFLGDMPLLKVAEYTLVFTIGFGGTGIAAALMVSRYGNGRQSISSVLANLSILVVTCGLSLTGAEYALRFIYSDVTTTGDSRNYFDGRWLETVRLNRFEFRERDFETRKPDKVYRIAVIGDSLTFGKGIEENNRFSNLLEKRLNRASVGEGSEYEVLNFGRSGANTADETEIMKEFVLPADPDFIVLQWYKNDVIDNQARNRIRPAERAKPPLQRKLGRNYSRLTDNSILFSLLDTQLRKAAQPFSGDEKARLTNFDDEAMLRLFGDPGSPAALRAAVSLEEFLDLAEGNGIPVGMVLFTDSYFRPDSGLDYLLERVLDVCEQRKLTCVDMRGPLQPYAGDHRLWASRLDPHPSAFTNRIAAEQIFTAFAPRWLRGR